MTAMKRIFFIIVFLGLCSSAEVAASLHGIGDREALWNEANTLYVNGDYNGAIAVYEAIINDGYVSSKLYYNLGNAYFKTNSTGKAIVNYNRAQRLAPYDKDIEYNLAVANSYVKDRIEVVPEFFLNNWARQARMSLSSNMWAVISLIMLAVALVFALLYFLSQKKGVRKAGFFTAIVFALFFVMSLSFSVTAKNRQVNAAEAIVTASAVSVKSSPDSSSKDLFIIHEGTKVEVLNRFNSWTEVQIADGNKGWLTTGAIELID